MSEERFTVEIDHGSAHALEHVLRLVIPAVVHGPSEAADDLGLAQHELEQLQADLRQSVPCVQHDHAAPTEKGEGE